MMFSCSRLTFTLDRIDAAPREKQCFHSAQLELNVQLCNTEDMSKGPLILLFIKTPVRGYVKARLAESIGEEAALDLYKNFVLDILDTLKSSRYPFRICFSPPEAASLIADWLGPAHQYDAQYGKDLGERMEHAFRKAFSEGHDAAVLVGSDIPDLPKSVFHEAIGVVEARDMAIGPAVDGGYYMIGLTRSNRVPDLFRGIAWSSSTVFPQTMNVASRAGLVVHQLPLWRDVDTLDDLQDLFTRNKMTFFSGSRTMACVARLAAGGKLKPERAAGKT